MEFLLHQNNLYITCKMVILNQNNIHYLSKYINGLLIYQNIQYTGIKVVIKLLDLENLKTKLFMIRVIL
jgi:hypothetical protein